jgi:hypothetical protein
MRRMSFSMTTEAMLAKRKTVTRRLGWASVRPGELILAVDKCMGLKKGEKAKRLHVIRVSAVRRERLDRMTADDRYGRSELRFEGYGPRTTLTTPKQFVDRLCTSLSIKPDQEVTRIQFAFVPFSLTCERCDAGTDIASFSQAEAEGWLEIMYHDGPGWNFIGVCPECANDDEE